MTLVLSGRYFPFGPAMLPSDVVAHLTERRLSEFHIMRHPTAAFIEGCLHAPSRQREGHFQPDGPDGTRSGDAKLPPRTFSVAFLLALMVTMTWATVATAGTALAAGPGDGSGPWELGWIGFWIIFPIIMIPTMLAFTYFMFMRGGGRPPWQDSERDYREPEEHRSARRSESAPDILKLRYASGEVAAFSSPHLSLLEGHAGERDDSKGCSLGDWHE